MWHLATVNSPYTLWCSDGKPIDAIRGGVGESSRFIVDGQGFLDITELKVMGEEAEWILIDSRLNSTDEEIASVFNVNGLRLWKGLDHEPSDLSLALHLEIETNGKFNLFMISNTEDSTGRIEEQTSSTPLLDLTLSSQHMASGDLKPLPQVSALDAAFFDSMITDKLVPYPEIGDAPGKSEDEIRALGQQLFPFSPYSFQLAMAVYDWTTASFSRMVLLNMFQYTALELQHTTPRDQQSIAKAIWTSNWGSFTAQDPHFMASFMMKPAWTQLEVELQLLHIRAKLEKAVEVENRLLSAAMESLPRTSILSKPHLFSGQLDLSQLDIGDFAISFRECPSNKGPIFQPLRHDLAKATSTYLAEGKVVTTKVTWSFTDSIDEAMHYSNGIILVADFSDDSRVWETASYITPLSIDPKKTEYTFPPGSQFEVQSVDETILMGRSLLIFKLQPKFLPIYPVLPVRSSGFDEILPCQFEKGDVARLIGTHTPSLEPPHALNSTGGRRCDCFVTDAL
ncbi:hypothetical protein N7457_004133 [Penicillium paradoxum]|uniref:uncharacterized protein n=1 Tax=Penicillium paradoxum TaxID=176176 RepID=UPI0025477474|nr:uncharacterized protein N7457_004133 [Penicillium paradoxum]KAJ5782359.1 hypothetical protein N7457_004133 [Penicillium paradoxum]